MFKTISLNELQEQLREVVNEVVEDQTPYILAHDGRHEVALIPYDEYLRYQQYKEDVFARFDHVRARMAVQNAKYSEDEVIADIEAPRAEVRNGMGEEDRC